jgi:hypothetical protein
MTDFNPRDVILHLPHRQGHEPIRIRLTHERAGLEGLGEAATFDVAYDAAKEDLERQLQEKDQKTGKWPRAAS